MKDLTAVSVFNRIFAGRESITRDALVAKLVEAGINATSAKWYISAAKLPLPTPKTPSRNLFDVQIVESKDDAGATMLTRVPVGPYRLKGDKGADVFRETFNRETGTVAKKDLIEKLVKAGVTAGTANSYIVWAKRTNMGAPHHGNPWDFVIEETKDKDGNKVLRRAVGLSVTDDEPADIHVSETKEATRRTGDKSAETTKVKARKRKTVPYMARRKPGTVEILLWGIPKPVKEAFHIRCIRNGTTMTEQIIELMRAYGTEQMPEQL